ANTSPMSRTAVKTTPPCETGTRPCVRPGGSSRYVQVGGHIRPSVRHSAGYAEIASKSSTRTYPPDSDEDTTSPCRAATHSGPHAPRAAVHRATEYVANPGPVPR